MAFENRAQIRNLVRAKLQAWPEQVTTLAAAVTDSAGNTITLASASDLIPRQLLEVDSEVMRIKDVTAAPVISVLRGDQGSNPTAHANAATIKSYPFWGWTDFELNQLINLAIDWTFPEIWYPKWYANTFLANQKEFGLPAGVSYPDGEQIKRVEILRADGFYKPVYNWRHEHDRIIFEHPMDQAYTARILVHGKHIRFENDSTPMHDSNAVMPVIQYATSKALENLLGARTRFAEYSATLNDRASTPDELQRQVYFFYNQAILAKDQASRVPLSGFASVRRSG